MPSFMSIMWWNSKTSFEKFSARYFELSGHLPLIIIMISFAHIFSFIISSMIKIDLSHDLIEMYNLPDKSDATNPYFMNTFILTAACSTIPLTSSAELILTSQLKRLNYHVDSNTMETTHYNNASKTSPYITSSSCLPLDHSIKKSSP